MNTETFPELLLSILDDEDLIRLKWRACRRGITTLDKWLDTELGKRHAGFGTSNPWERFCHATGRARKEA